MADGAAVPADGPIARGPNALQDRIDFARWGPALGWGRTLLFSVPLLTLLATPAQVLLRTDTGDPTIFPDPTCGGLGERLSPVCAGSTSVWTWVLIAVIALAAIGWRPRVTALPAAYAVWALDAASWYPTLGAVVTTMGVVILVPISLADPRRWHWQTATAGSLSRTVLVGSILVGRVILASVYLGSALEKLGGSWFDDRAQWANLRSNLSQAPDPVRRLLEPILDGTPVAVALSIAVFTSELVFAASLLGPWRLRRIVFPMAVGFHLMIGLVMGIGPGSLAMIAIGIVLWPRLSHTPATRSPGRLPTTGPPRQKSLPHLDG